MADKSARKMRFQNVEYSSAPMRDLMSQAVDMSNLQVSPSAFFGYCKLSEKAVNKFLPYYAREVRQTGCSKVKPSSFRRSLTRLVTQHHATYLGTRQTVADSVQPLRIALNIIGHFRSAPEMWRKLKRGRKFHQRKKLRRHSIKLMPFGCLVPGIPKLRNRREAIHKLDIASKWQPDTTLRIMLVHPMVRLLAHFRMVLVTMEMVSQHSLDVLQEHSA